MNWFLLVFFSLWSLWVSLIVASQRILKLLAMEILFIWSFPKFQDHNDYEIYKFDNAYSLEFFSMSRVMKSYSFLGLMFDFVSQVTYFGFYLHFLFYWSFLQTIFSIWFIRFEWYFLGVLQKYQSVCLTVFSLSFFSRSYGAN